MSTNPTLSLPLHANGVTLGLDELLAYRAHAKRYLPPAKSLWSQLNGIHQSRYHGRGMDFSEVRTYQAGDDIRSIDWRVTARTGKAHTKLFTEEKERAVLLYLDLSASMHVGSTLMLKSVQQAHLASLLSWIAVSQGDRIGAVIDTGSHLHDLRPTARKQGALHLLQSLTEQHNVSLNNSGTLPTGFSAGLGSLNQLSPKGSEVMIISDFTRLSESDEPLLNRLCAHNRVKFIHVYDPLERGETSFRGNQQITDGKQDKWFNFGSRKQRLALEDTFKQHQHQLEQRCHRLGIPLNSLSAAAPLLDQLHGGLYG